MIEEESKKESRPLGIELIRLTYKHRLFIGTSIIAVILGSWIFTSPFFIKSEYASEAVIYPSGENTSTGLVRSDMKFGSDKDVDNAMQILQSTVLKKALVDKYNLIARYEIDTADPRWLYNLNEKYSDNVVIDRTRYNSIIVRVYDEDPETAAALANDIIYLGDSVKAEILKKNLRNTYNIIKKELETKSRELMVLADSINYLRRKNYAEALALRSTHFQNKKNTVSKLRSSIDQVRNDEGVYDIGKQYESLYESYLQANAEYLTDSGMVAVMSQYLPQNDTALVKRRAALEGARLLAKDTRKKLLRLNKSGEEFNRLLDNYYVEKSVLSDIQGDYEFSLSTFDKEYGNLALETLKSKYASELDLFNQIKVKHDLALNNLTDFVPASYVISPAEAIHKKVAPKRMLITILLTISVYFIIILGLITKENYSKIEAAIKD